MDALAGSNASWTHMSINGQADPVQAVIQSGCVIYELCGFSLQLLRVKKKTYVASWYPEDQPSS